MNLRAALARRGGRSDGGRKRQRSDKESGDKAGPSGSTTGQGCDRFPSCPLCGEDFVTAVDVFNHVCPVAGVDAALEWALDMSAGQACAANAPCIGPPAPQDVRRFFDVEAGHSGDEIEEEKASDVDSNGHLEDFIADMSEEDAPADLAFYRCADQAENNATDSGPEPLMDSSSDSNGPGDATLFSSDSGDFSDASEPDEMVHHPALDILQYFTDLPEKDLEGMGDIEGDVAGDLALEVDNADADDEGGAPTAFSAAATGSPSHRRLRKKQHIEQPPNSPLTLPYAKGYFRLWKKQTCPQCPQPPWGPLFSVAKV